MVKKPSTARRRAEQDQKSNDPSILVIDEHRLEKEWSSQASLFFRFASELADARLANDQAKVEVDITFAELDTAIRSDPERFGISKVSESAIKNAILQQSSYQTAQEALNATTHAVRMLEAMTRALEHRKSALKGLVELRLANYYAEPTLPKVGQEAFDEHVRREVQKKTRRRPNREDDDSDDDDE